MKAIILAAGVGSRLRPMTNDKPKTLVKVNNRPMLQHIIESLTANGINEIVVCIGYMGGRVIAFCRDAFPNVDFTFISNADFETTNNLYTLYLAQKHMSEDFLLMNADLVFERGIIEKLVAFEGSAFCIEKGVYLEESMKVTVNEGGNINGISKKIGEKEAYGTSIDVYRFSKEAGGVLRNALKQAIECDRRLNDWSETLFNDLMKNGHINIAPLDVNGIKWFEIDNYEDLAKAEVLFNLKLKAIKEKKAFIFDVDGTIYLDNRLFAGVKELFEKLKAQEKLYI